MIGKELTTTEAWCDRERSVYLILDRPRRLTGQSERQYVGVIFQLERLNDFFKSKIQCCLCKVTSQHLKFGLMEERCKSLSIWIIGEKIGYSFKHRIKGGFIDQGG